MNSQVSHAGPIGDAALSLSSSQMKVTLLSRRRRHTRKTEPAARPLMKALEKQNSELTGSTVLMAADRIIQRQASFPDI